MNYFDFNTNYGIKQNSYQARNKGKLTEKLSPQEDAWEAGTTLLCFSD